MKRLIWAPLLAGALLALAPLSANAQIFQGQRVTTCGTGGSAVPPGSPAPVTIDQNGYTCTSGTGGGGGGGAVTAAVGSFVTGYSPDVGSSSTTAWTGTGTPTMLGLLQGIYNGVILGTGLFGAVSPTSGIAIGAKNGTNLVQLSADGSNNLNVNCTVGCGGAGTVSNAGSAVATSSTNIGAVSWNYGFNGTTWDQLQVDGSKNLKVNCTIGCAGGSTSNATSGVATSSTNGATVAWLYAFNGTTWDQLQDDASKNLKVGGIASSFVDGWSVTAGTKADAAYAGSGGASEIAALKGIYNAAIAPLAAGSAIIGKVGIDQTTPGTTNGTSLAFIGGSAVAAGSGAAGAAAARVTVATDSATVAGSASLPTGSNIVGKVGIDQTTPGTTNAVQITGALPALATGSNVVGQVSINQTTPGTTNAVQSVPGTTGGLSFFFLQPIAGNNSTNIKASAGQLYHVTATNNSATINYLRFYNTAGAPTCTSATGIVYQIAIPASTSGAGFVQDISMGLPFSTGIGICVTSGYTTTDNTNATANAISLTVLYK